MLSTEEVRARWLRSSLTHPRIVEFLAAHADHYEDGDCVYFVLYCQFVTLGFVPERYADAIAQMLAQRN